jgi:small subunit ribosomal protein S18
LSERDRPERDRSGSNGDDRGGGRGGGGGRFSRRPRVCRFCAEKITTLDYKQVEMVKRYVTDAGKIRSRRETGNCAKHQRIVARSVKRARHLALVPYASDRLR